MNGPALTAAAGLWRLAARTFATEIDPPFYRALLRLTAGSAAYRAAIVPPDMREGTEREVLRELAVEYCRLFVGPRAACPPYGSIQRGEAHLDGRTRHRVQGLMARYALDAACPAELPVLAEDHISVGMAVLDHLHTRAAEDDAQAAEAARAFRETYLLGWAPRFLETVQGESPRSPYGAIAQVTTTALLDDALFDDEPALGRY